MTNQALNRRWLGVITCYKSRDYVLDAIMIECHNYMNLLYITTYKISQDLPLPCPFFSSLWGVFASWEAEQSNLPFVLFLLSFAEMPPKSAKSKEPLPERPILGRFTSHLKIGIVSKFSSFFFFPYFFKFIHFKLNSCPASSLLIIFSFFWFGFFFLVLFIYGFFLFLSLILGSNLSLYPYLGHFLWFFFELGPSYCIFLWVLGVYLFICLLQCLRWVCPMWVSLLSSTHSQSSPSLPRTSHSAPLSPMRPEWMFPTSVLSGYASYTSPKVR